MHEHACRLKHTQQPLRDSRFWWGRLAPGTERRCRLVVEAVGSIPTPAAQRTEFIGLDEKPVLKTGGDASRL